MSEEDQQAPPTQEDVKTGDNAPINVKVRRFCLSFISKIDVWEMRWQQVVSSSGEEVFFKIKRVTPLRKLLVAYATKVGKEPHTIR